MKTLPKRRAKRNSSPIQPKVSENGCGFEKLFYFRENRNLDQFVQFGIFVPQAFAVALTPYHTSSCGIAAEASRVAPKMFEQCNCNDLYSDKFSYLVSVLRS